MAKKLILLLLIIPIVVMIILFAASDAVANMVDVHVDGIYIVNNPQNVYLDFDKGETYTFEYVVTPTGAKNKEIYPRIDAVGDEPKANFDIDTTQPGKVTLTPLSTGSATIHFITVDNAEKDSLTVHVRTNELQSIDSTISRDVLVLGGEEGADTATITTTVYPQTLAGTTLYYSSSDEKIARVDSEGKVTAVGRGPATITITAGEGENAKTATVDVVVEMEGKIAAATPKPTSKGVGEHTIDFNYPVEFTEENLDIRVYDANGEEITDYSSVIKGEFEMLVKDVGKQRAKFSYEFAPGFVGDITVEFVLKINGEEDTFSQTFSKVDKISLDYNKNVFGVSAANTGGFSLYFSVIPSDILVEWGEVVISNPALISTAASDITTSVTNGDGRLTLKTLGKAGTVTVSLTVYNKLDPTDYATFEKTIEIGVTAIDIVKPLAKGDKAEYGLEGLFTIGGKKWSGTNGDGIPNDIVDAEFTLEAVLSKSDEMIDGYNYKEHFRWYSSQPDKVKIDEKTGVISYADGYTAEDEENPPEIEFRISYVFGDKEYVSPTRFAIRCVKNGINVYNYAELYYATKKEGHPIVLRADIIDDFGEINGDYVLEKDKLYEKIDTTYDYTYYYNKWIAEGRAADQFEIPQVITLLQFREDLYGNGHEINAHNATMGLELGPNGNKAPVEGALFQGPLNFVRAQLDENSIRGASVKAQDNICFALYDDVDVTNVRLLGCNPTSDDKGQINLIDLNWVGTTVEVLGTNVNIQYSRLINGRTVLRAFGDEKDAEKEIELTVSNCVLQQAREFIMRIGSNRFVNGGTFDKDNIFQSAKLPFDQKDNSSNLPFYPLEGIREKDDPDKRPEAYDTIIKQQYSSYDSETKRVYDDAFINTFVTVRDCVFTDTGIFAIAMDSHFAGPMLYDGPSAVANDLKMPSYADKFSTWHDLAKTSYGAKLTIEGKIGLYNWKKLSTVDSTTLIEITGVKEPQNEEELNNLDEVAKLLWSLNLNLQNMVEKAEETHKNITTMYKADGDNEQTKHVHAGIAFFGGGKNYSVLEIADDAGGMIADLAPHPISLAQAGELKLETAAGSESFCFFICSGATVENNGFSPAKQKEILASGEDAYGFVYKSTKK